MEVIVSFLAVLELIKIGKIEVHQEKTFDDILQNDTLTNLTESYHKELLEAIEKEREKTNHE